ncbi:transketolase [Psychrobacter sp. 1501(2011)]|nr:transketolase [Psychrobacter sp. 1501(2011)]
MFTKNYLVLIDHQNLGFFMSTPISERKLANAIRVLSFDAVQKANSGHPGAPMGMADIAEVLWRKFLKHNPANPNWHNRDRFVLSNGHGSMLIYSLLHLTGYDVSIDDLKNFRQLHSKTPGHPELGYTPGVETTTGPLGQGIANAVGFAIAEKTLAAQFNREGHNIIDHHTYAFLGDGCLMEGISHEVASLAGTLGLGKLVFFYDDNGISIDGEVEGWFTDDTQKRFESYGWQVIKVDGHDTDAITKATEEAIAETSKPSLIICKTIIGVGSPNKQGKASSHGAPLGDDEITLTRSELAWTHAPFDLDDEIYEGWDAKAKGDVLEKNWNADFEAYKKAYPELAAELLRRLEGDLPADFDEQAQAYIQQCQEQGENVASRKASFNAINTFQPLLPELMGGSADLAGSNLTLFKDAKGIEKDADGNYIYYGVREFGMTAIANGIALHGGFIPYVATFLMFMEYARNAVRMGALMKQRVIHVYTHDSIGLGEDGPTHQPVEQLTSLRTTPNLHTWRPCDTTESATAWAEALKAKNNPSALIFSRQNLPHQQRDSEQVANIAKGGYVLAKEQSELQAIIIATGSEVSLAMNAYNTLSEQGVGVRVVSMPCAEVFTAQDSDYREAVLPSNIRARVAVEAAHVDYWYKFVGLDGKVIGMTTYGESAPAEVLFKEFGITDEAVVDAVKSLVS